MKTRYIILTVLAATVVFIALASLLLTTLPTLTQSAHVAVIPVTGIITIDSPTGLLATQTASSTQITRWIEQASEDSSVQAILLEINSPGGSAVASDEITRAVQAVDNKPVVAWIREAGASGAYWIASEADHIIANRMSITGSVGVVASYLSFDEFIQDYNITYQEVSAGEDKELGNPFTELDERQEGLLQEKIDLIHAFFLDDVAENRNLTAEQKEAVGSGIFYLGAEAIELGLVDELGTRQEVQAYLEELLEAEPRYTRYQRQQGLFDIFSVQLPTTGWQIQAR